MEINEKICALALQLIFGYEPRFAKVLIDSFGSAQAVFEAPAWQVDSIFPPHSKYKGAIRPEILKTAEDMLKQVEDSGAWFLEITHPAFPSVLLQCPDPPIGLFVRSDSTPEDIFGRCNYVSIVGTRDISPYGKEWCQKTVHSLSRYRRKPTIVSGLALGVDITAHETALACGLPTIAVIPTGIDMIYPRRHYPQARAIASSPGSALITDFPIGTSPQGFTFLRRNRIIAALSSTTILIESMADGGGKITAHLAAQYGKDVYALPGRIDDSRSAGCNALIAEKIAEPLVSLNTLGVQIGLGELETPHEMKKLEARIEQQYADSIEAQQLHKLCRIGKCIRENRAISIEQMASALCMPYKEIAYLCERLQSDGFIYIDILGQCTIAFKNA